MRRMLALLLLVGTLAGVGSLRADEATWAQLTAWVDKYPDEKINGVDFWTHPLLSAELKRLLGDEAFKIFNDHMTDVMTPIQRRDDIVYAFTCREHACDTDAAFVFANIKTGKINICWHERSQEQDFWFSSDKKAVGLSGDGCGGPKDDFDVYKNNMKE